MSFNGDAMTPVPVDPSLYRRFHEAVLFYCSLISLFAKKNQATVLESDVPTRLSTATAKKIYLCFVDKLSQICDRKRGGDTVTSFAVLSTASIEYLFASNKRNEDELGEVKRFVRRILTMLHNVPEKREVEEKGTTDQVSAPIIDAILRFNRPRIGYYIKLLAEQLDFCISRCEDEGSDSATLAARHLRGLESLTTQANNVDLEDNEFVNLSSTLLKAIDVGYREKFEEYIRDKTRSDQAANKTPWTDLRHALARLHSYFIAVGVLLQARWLWPELFEHFEVTSVPSSEAPPNAARPLRQTTSKIIHRLTPDAGIRDIFTREAKLLQEMGLDFELTKKIKSFKPIVHAELLVFDEVERRKRDPDRESAPRFFKEDEFCGPYVGSSKPTCGLCDLFLGAQPNVQRRTTSGNYYSSWRAPDIFEHDGPEEVTRRKKVLEEMLSQVKRKIFEVVKTRIAPIRLYDSNNTASDPRRTAVGTIDDDMASIIAQVDSEDRDWTPLEQTQAAGSSEIRWRSPEHDRYSVKTEADVDSWKELEEKSGQVAVQSVVSRVVEDCVERESEAKIKSENDDDEGDDDDKNGGARL